MSGNEQEIAELMVRASAALKAIADSAEASQEARDAAYDSYQDVLLLIARHAITTYEGRTAALTGLIVELQEATANIEVANPITGPLNDIADIGDKAAELFRKEKKTG